MQGGKFPYEFSLINITGIYELYGENDESLSPWQPPSDVDDYIKSKYAILYAEYTKIKAGISIVELALQGPSGETGEKGDSGPTGEKGDSGLTNVLVLITEGIKSEISKNSAIPLNMLRLNTDYENMIYNNSTSSVKFLKPGLYAFDWWLAVEGSNATGPIIISLEIVDYYGNTSYRDSSYPMIISGLIYGHNLIVTTTEVEIRLLNNSSGSIKLSDYTPVQSNVRVLANYY